MKKYEKRESEKSGNPYQSRIMTAAEQERREILDPGPRTGACVVRLDGGEWGRLVGQVCNPEGLQLSREVYPTLDDALIAHRGWL